MKYVDHPFVKANQVAERDYQREIAERALRENLLVVLPTGAGKTVIALRVIAEILERNPDGRALVMAPTRPLVKQHMDYMKRSLTVPKQTFVWLTGEVPPPERASLWREKQIFFATPQVVLNDLLSGRLSLEDLDVVVFDEAHRGVRDHAYAKVCSVSQPTQKRIIRLGLTASPGDEERIKEILRNLRLDDITIKTREERDLGRYLEKITPDLHLVEKDLVLDYATKLLHEEAKEIVNSLKSTFSGEPLKLRADGLSYTTISRVRNLSEKRFWSGELTENQIWKVRKELAALTKLDKLIQYLEGYSYRAFLEYVQRLKTKGSRRRASTERRMLSRSRLREAVILIQQTVDKGTEHPKLEEAVRTVKMEQRKGGRILLFVGLREVANQLEEALTSEGLNPSLLVGQQASGRLTGMSQREQLRSIEDFRWGHVNPLIATQIGEEGLDIAECNVVVFYDNPVSAIRRIQRMGRTGRAMPGRAIFLVLKGGRDEGRYWAGLRRQRKLERETKALKLEKPAERSLLAYTEERKGVTIAVDHREARSQVVEFLKGFEVQISLKDLKLGDYVLSDRVVVERKSPADFAASIMDGRLFQQVRNLKDGVSLPILIVEGEAREITRRIAEKAFTGAVASVMLDFDVPVLRTSTPRETALILYSIAHREQVKERRPVSVRLERKPISDAEMMKYLVSGLPNVDVTLAERLLERFGAAEEVFTATEEELMKVKGIGEKIAEGIRRVLTLRYR
ncbi:MAG: ERCC4 domain-containing protein [Candidatus Geothermarchaeales archaeon]